MAQINLHNPTLLSARRGRSTTVLSLRAECGSVVNLVFTSFGALTALEADTQEAVHNILPSEGGRVEWASSRVPRRSRAARRRRVEDLGALYLLGLLDSPFRRL